MGGFLGIGGSSATSDRNSYLASQGNLNNVFNYGIPTGESGVKTGNQTLANASESLGPAASYYSKLLQPGRSFAASLSAPATNAAQGASDATRNEEAQQGTGRAGGTVEANREAGASTNKNIDDIINNTLHGGRKEAAEGLTRVAGTEAAIGGTQLSSAENLLGLGTQAESTVNDNSLSSRELSNQISGQTGQALGQAAGMALMFALAA